MSDHDPLTDDRPKPIAYIAMFFLGLALGVTATAFVAEVICG